VRKSVSSGIVAPGDVVRRWRASPFDLASVISIRRYVSGAQSISVCSGLWIPSILAILVSIKQSSKPRKIFALGVEISMMGFALAIFKKELPKSTPRIRVMIHPRAPTPAASTSAVLSIRERAFARSSLPRNANFAKGFDIQLSLCLFLIAYLVKFLCLRESNAEVTALATRIRSMSLMAAKSGVQ
jgi:hypothetical protein